MGERAEFGPSLRGARMRRGISIAQLTAKTKVGADLWEALERNDLSRWPSGLYARAYVRTYAIEVGLDPEATVDEFCRCFPAGDRRAGRRVREQAELLGHELRWEDDLSQVEADRRAAPADTHSAPFVFRKGGRLIAAASDGIAVLVISTAVAALFHTRWTTAAFGCALAYHAGSLLVIGCTPAAWAVDTYLASRHPADRPAAAPKILRLVRGSERAKA
jgi:hypothetical protein